jgi:hypothetical protein
MNIRINLKRVRGGWNGKMGMHLCSTFAQYFGLYGEEEVTLVVSRRRPSNMKNAYEIRYAGDGDVEISTIYGLEKEYIGIVMRHHIWDKLFDRFYDPPEGELMWIWVELS